MKTIIVTGDNRELMAKSIEQVLGKKFTVKKCCDNTPNFFDKLISDVLVMEADLKDRQVLEVAGGALKHSQSSILILGNGVHEEPEVTKVLIKEVNSSILFYDNKAVRDLTQGSNVYTFGLEDGADFRASDININGHTNFKVNYKGSSIPIWQEGVSGNENVYSGLAASCVGILCGLNFVEISDALKNKRV